jgi:hypothetical protein
MKPVVSVADGWAEFAKGVLVMTHDNPPPPGAMAVIRAAFYGGAHMALQGMYDLGGNPGVTEDQAIATLEAWRQEVARVIRDGAQPGPGPV